MPTSTPLSSNWKELQKKLKATSKSSDKKPPASAPVSTGKVGNKKSKYGTKPAPSNPLSAKGKANRVSKTMGNAQSSKVASSSTTAAASSALWTGSKKIDADDLAAAYNLKSTNGPFLLERPGDKENGGLTPNISPGKYIALDCEMVGVAQPEESALARVSVVDFHGTQLYDAYVRPQGRVTDWRTRFSGIEPRHMKMARPFEQAQKEVKNLLKDRILIGHDISNDLSALKLTHPPKDIRDTAKTPQFKKYGNGRKPALRVLARQLLQTTIQEGAHSSVIDARCTMELFRRYKAGFDADHASRYSNTKKPQSARKKR